MKKDNKDYLKILKYFFYIKGWLIALALIMIGYIFTNAFIPIVNAKLVTSLTNFSINAAISLTLLFLILSLFKILFRKLTDFIFFKKIKNIIIYNIRSDSIKSIFQMKTVNFDKYSSGEFTERLKNDPESISTIISIVQFNFFSMLGDLIILGYVFYINIIIGMIYLVCIIGVYFYEKKAFANHEKLIKEISKLKDKNSTLLNESMRGIRDIKILNIANSFKKLVNNNLKETTNYDTDLSIDYGLILNRVDIIEIFTTVLIVLLGIYLVSINKLTTTNLLIIFMYRFEIFSLIYSYTSIKEYLVKFKIASSRIFELINDEKFSKEKFGNYELENVKGKIEIKNLMFGYDKKQVLKGINMKVKPNDTIAIVGASGSGKTTLFNLLSKSYEVPNNMIYIDDVDINELSQDSIRNNISVITQNPYLFNLSIKDNFKLINSKITIREIKEICKIAQIHDYIETLPYKYDTILGEGGVTLSGGQKQRLAIARALIKKSKIILFDEATSALDNITQSEIQKSINNISKDYTMIIVAHRLSTIKECSKIYVLDDGKIVGVGTHKELLENNKYYQKLYRQELV